MTTESSSKTPKSGGDDLDDGLALDTNLLASSETGHSGNDIGEGVWEGSDDDVGSEEGQAGDDDEPVLPGGKRKATQEIDEEARKAEKKRRRKEKDKEKRAKRMRNHPTNITQSTTATHLTPSQLSAILLSSIREAFPAATPMEIEDIIIPADHILEPPVYPPLSDPEPFSPLIERIRSLLNMSKKKISPATPRIIILSLSGIRCADVVRAVKPYKGSGEVAKLFAKHFKLEDQIKHLAKTRTSIAVGTPARVGKLLAEGAMKITSNTVILLDVTYKDPKQRSLLTLPEILTEMWKSVFSGKARQSLIQGGAKVGAF